MQWSRVGKLYLPQIAIFVLDKEEIKLWGGAEGIFILTVHLKN